MTAKYELLTDVTATIDGSGIVKHNIQALDTDDDIEWHIVPNHHKDFCIPAADLQAVMDMPHSPGAERQAKIAAYKNLLIANWNLAPIPYTWPPTSNWSNAGIEAYSAAYAIVEAEVAAINAIAAAAAVAANTFISDVLGKQPPMQFSLSREGINNGNSGPTA